MKYIKFFRRYNDIDSICKKYGIKNYTVRDGLVDVDASVNLAYKDISELPLSFGIVNGSFDCREIGLTTLKGCPIEVASNLALTGNKLTSLKYCSKIVDSSLYVNGNMLTTMEGCPQYVRYSIFCNDNKLITLKGTPKKINQNFNCSANDLLSFKDGPIEIENELICSHNNFKTLKYFPKVNNGDITMVANPLPKEIYNNCRYIKGIVKYQNEYQIWNYNDTLNLPRFELMMEEIIDIMSDYDYF